RVRRALAFAINRNDAAQRYYIRAVPTCQALVPNLPGYQPYCPYTQAPGPSGAWTAPDLMKARDLVAQSGTKGMPVTFYTWAAFKATGDYVASVLRTLGYPTTVKVYKDFGKFYVYVTNSRNRAQAAGYWGAATVPSASQLIGATGGYTCDSFIPNDAG